MDGRYQTQGVSVSVGCAVFTVHCTDVQRGEERADLTELAPEEGGHEEKRRGSHEGEAVLSSGENRSVALCRGR